MNDKQQALLDSLSYTELREVVWKHRRVLSISEYSARTFLQNATKELQSDIDPLVAATLEVISGIDSINQLRLPGLLEILAKASKDGAVNNGNT